MQDQHYRGPISEPPVKKEPESYQQGLDSDSPVTRRFSCLGKNRGFRSTGGTYING